MKKSIPNQKYYQGQYQGHHKNKNRNKKPGEIFKKIMSYGLVLGGVGILGSLVACHHPYDPQKNPLLTQPIASVVPSLMVLENAVRQDDLKGKFLPNNDPDISLINACSVNKNHFETPDALGSKNCDFIFKKIVEEASHQVGVLQSLTVEDLTDPRAQERIHHALFSMAAYGHLPQENS